MRILLLFLMSAVSFTSYAGSSITITKCLNEDESVHVRGYDLICLDDEDCDTIFNKVSILTEGADGNLLLKPNAIHRK
ncbi:MAG: hypothetical protein HRT44_03515 [Bdellovibrionales bacterium]|nr:hypothetical protein [Bdellovibrionales bacterium]NQZ18314.1 hypothetical protein [Bdellovibrionales bacterium]